MSKLLLLFGFICITASMVLWGKIYFDSKKSANSQQMKFSYKIQSKHRPSHPFTMLHLIPTSRLVFFAICSFALIPLVIAAIFLSVVTPLAVLMILILYYVISFLFFMVMLMKRSRFIKKFRKVFPDAIEAMIHDLRAGRPLIIAIKNVGLHFHNVVGKTFANIYHNTELGLSLQDVLLAAKERWVLPEFSHFSSVIQLHLKTGSDPTLALLSLIKLQRQDELLRKKISSYAMDGRISAIAFSILPVVVLVMLWKFGVKLRPEDNVLSYFVTHRAGNYAMIYMILSYVIGVCLLFKIAHVKK